MNPITVSKLFKKRLGDYGLNVYQGCEHGCTFCYAPAQPGVRAQEFWRDKTQADWGSHFQERPGLLVALQRQLSHFTPEKAVKTAWGQGWILLSFLCDAYQPLEATLGITRQALQMLLESGHKVRIQTRSDLVQRDFDLLLAHKHQIRLGTSLPYLDDQLAALLEPKAAPPSERLKTLTAAARMGIPVYVALAPVMPFNSVSVLDELISVIKPLQPVEVFCEVLNPKGQAVPIVAQALARKYPCESAVVARYDEAAWAKWTHEVLAYGFSRYHQLGFVPWPDTGRAWERHLSPREIQFLSRFLPHGPVGPASRRLPIKNEQ